MRFRDGRRPAVAVPVAVVAVAVAVAVATGLLTACGGSAERRELAAHADASPPPSADTARPSSPAAGVGPGTDSIVEGAYPAPAYPRGPTADWHDRRSAIGTTVAAERLRSEKHRPTAPPTPPRSATPLPSPTPSPTATPAPSILRRAWEQQIPAARQSALVVHRATGRVYASQADARGGVSLFTYAASDGRLEATQPLFPEEVLLDVDDAGRVYLLHSDNGVRVLEPGTLRDAVLTVPTPDWSDPALQRRLRSPDPAWPIVDRARGHLLAFSGARVTVVDAASRAAVREFEVPPEGTHGSIVRAALDSAGAILYLALADHGLDDWEGAPGVRLLALDYATLEIIDQGELRASAGAWIPTGDGVIVSGGSYKKLGSDYRVWKKGLEVSRRTEGDYGWSVYDGARDRVMGAAWFEPEELIVADGTTLDLRFVTSRITESLTAYDPGTDQFYARGGDATALTVVDAARIAPETPRERKWSATWEAGGAVGLPHTRPDCFVGSPDFERDQTVFACVSGFGVFRSEDGGRSWTPASDGLGTLWVREVVLSPTYAQDGTLFAGVEVSYGSAGFLPRPTAWRSRDRGESWEPIGALAAIAASPTFARDDRVMAFQYVAEYRPPRGLGARFYVSTNGGSTWEGRGRLPDIELETFTAGSLWVMPAVGERPEILIALATSGSEMGGAQHWNEQGARLFRSADAGFTWEYAWGEYGHRGWDPVMLGPYVPRRSEADDAADVAVWMFGFEGGEQATVMSRDGGMTWHQVHLPADPQTRLVALWPDGTLAVDGFEKGRRTIRVEDYEVGPPPDVER